MPKTRRKFNPGGFFVVMLFSLFVAGGISGVLAEEWSSEPLRITALILIAPLCICAVLALFYGLFHLSTTAGDDD